jgi:hypothetical protein
MDMDASNLPQTSSLRALIAQHKRSPNDMASISETIARLMTHYWTADDHPAVRQAQIEDWLEDMVEFGPEIVRQACAEWRQTQTRRPTPAELRTITAQIQQRNAPKVVAMEMLQSDEEVRAKCGQRYFNCVGRLRERGVICFDDCRSAVCEVMGMTVAEVRIELGLEDGR